jgi:hypothetical protein
MKNSLPTGEERRRACIERLTRRLETLAQGPAHGIRRVRRTAAELSDLYATTYRASVSRLRTRERARS